MLPSPQLYVDYNINVHHRDLNHVLTASANNDETSPLTPPDDKPTSNKLKSQKASHGDSTHEPPKMSSSVSQYSGGTEDIPTIVGSLLQLPNGASTTVVQNGEGQQIATTDGERAVKSANHWKPKFVATPVPDSILMGRPEVPASPVDGSTTSDLPNNSGASPPPARPEVSCEEAQRGAGARQTQPPPVSPHDDTRGVDEVDANARSGTMKPEETAQPAAAAARGDGGSGDATVAAAVVAAASPRPADAVASNDNPSSSTSSEGASAKLAEPRRASTSQCQRTTEATFATAPTTVTGQNHNQSSQQRISGRPSPKPTSAVAVQGRATVLAPGETSRNRRDDNGTATASEDSQGARAHRQASRDIHSSTLPTSARQAERSIDAEGVPTPIRKTQTINTTTVRRKSSAERNLSRKQRDQRSMSLSFLNKKTFTLKDVEMGQYADEHPYWTTGRYRKFALKDEFCDESYFANRRNTFARRSIRLPRSESSVEGRASQRHQRGRERPSTASTTTPNTSQAADEVAPAKESEDQQTSRPVDDEMARTKVEGQRIPCQPPQSQPDSEHRLASRHVESDHPRHAKSLPDDEKKQIGVESAFVQPRMRSASVVVRSDIKVNRFTREESPERATGEPTEEFHARRENAGATPKDRRKSYQPDALSAGIRGGVPLDHGPAHAASREFTLRKIPPLEDLSDAALEPSANSLPVSATYSNDERRSSGQPLGPPSYNEALLGDQDQLLVAEQYDRHGVPLPTSRSGSSTQPPSSDGSSQAVVEPQYVVNYIEAFAEETQPLESTEVYAQQLSAPRRVQSEHIDPSSVVSNTITTYVAHSVQHHVQSENNEGHAGHEPTTFADAAAAAASATATTHTRPQENSANATTDATIEADASNQDVDNPKLVNDETEKHSRMSSVGGSTPLRHCESAPPADEAVLRGQTTHQLGTWYESCGKIEPIFVPSSHQSRKGVPFTEENGDITATCGRGRPDTFVSADGNIVLRQMPRRFSGVETTTSSREVEDIIVPPLSYRSNSISSAANGEPTQRSGVEGSADEYVVLRRPRQTEQSQSQFVQQLAEPGSEAMVARLSDEPHANISDRSTEMNGPQQQHINDSNQVRRHHHHHHHHHHQPSARDNAPQVKSLVEVAAPVLDDERSRRPGLRSNSCDALPLSEELADFVGNHHCDPICYKLVCPEQLASNPSAVHYADDVRPLTNLEILRRRRLSYLLAIEAMLYLRDHGSRYIKAAADLRNSDYKSPLDKTSASSSSSSDNDKTTASAENENLTAASIDEKVRCELAKIQRRRLSLQSHFDSQKPKVDRSLSLPYVESVSPVLGKYYNVQTPQPNASPTNQLTALSQNRQSTPNAEEDTEVTEAHLRAPSTCVEKEQQHVVPKHGRGHSTITSSVPDAPNNGNINNNLRSPVQIVRRSRVADFASHEMIQRNAGDVRTQPNDSNAVSREQAIALSALEVWRGLWESERPEDVPQLTEAEIVALYGPMCHIFSEHQTRPAVRQALREFVESRQCENALGSPKSDNQSTPPATSQHDVEDTAKSHHSPPVQRSQGQLVAAMLAGQRHGEHDEPVVKQL